MLNTLVPGKHKLPQQTGANNYTIQTTQYKEYSVAMYKTFVS